MFAVRNVERYRRESACVLLKGAGHPGVQSEWVGNTWFRRLVQKDSCFDLEQLRYVLQNVRKCSCGVDTTRKQKQRLGRCLFVCLIRVQQTSNIP